MSDNARALLEELECLIGGIVSDDDEATMILTAIDGHLRAAYERGWREGAEKMRSRAISHTDYMLGIYGPGDIQPDHLLNQISKNITALPVPPPPEPPEDS